MKPQAFCTFLLYVFYALASSLAFAQEDNKAYNNWTDNYSIASTDANAEGTVLKNIKFSAKYTQTRRTPTTFRAEVTFSVRYDINGYRYQGQVYPISYPAFKYLGGSSGFLPFGLKAKATLANGKTEVFQLAKGLTKYFDIASGHEKPKLLSDFAIRKIVILNESLKQPAVEEKITQYQKEQKQKEEKKAKILVAKKGDNKETDDGPTPKKVITLNPVAKKSGSSSRGKTDNGGRVGNGRKTDSRETFQDKAELANREAHIKARNAMVANRNKAYAIENASARFSSIMNTWAKERDFYGAVRSLSRIESRSIQGIIAEVRQKSQALDQTYAQRAADQHNRINQMSAQNASQAKNATEAQFNSTITNLSHMIAKSNLEKDRREAQRTLLAQQNSAIKELVKDFEDRIRPQREKYLQLAALSVTQAEEDYYLTYYNYNTCLENNAYQILQGQAPCHEPKLEAPNPDAKYDAQTYYEAYRRKKKSPLQGMDPAAFTMLELAIEADPNQPVWLRERATDEQLDYHDQLSILSRSLDLAPDDAETKKAYEKVLGDIRTEENKTKQFLTRKPDYDWDAHSGLMQVICERKVVYVNPQGEIMLNLNDKSTFPKGIVLARTGEQFNQGLLAVQDKKTGNWGYIKPSGEIVIPLKLPVVDAFHDGLAAIRDPKSNLVGFINLKGQLAVPCRFERAEHFSEGLCFVRAPYENKGYFINKRGARAFKKGYHLAGPFKNGTSVVTQIGSGLMGAGDKEWHIDTSGNKLNGKKYSTAYPYNKEGYAVVGNEQFARGIRWFMVDRAGKKTHEGTFENRPKFIAGQAEVNLGGTFKKKMAIIDMRGKIIKKMFEE
ncbi:WG repeat-containing protein [Fulvitalea axinellae]